MSSDDAIVFNKVCKTYHLYQNKWQMVKDALGFNNASPLQEFHALKDIDLTIKKGERVGLIGRNGAGKSTLLKLITGNFKTTSGTIVINGSVQALMNTGLGFHPEFTGLENIKASLLYNGLTKKQFDAAIEDIIDFVELGEFLDQPIKTYSLGMQARLYFAVATAIHPEILIVDEVLGAGDAYFSAKSADRMKRLTNTGCTLILVSHSTQQVLQFCENAYWIEAGQIVMRGKAIEVIKAYEAFTKKLEIEALASNTIPLKEKSSIIQSKWLREKLLSEILMTHVSNQHLDQDDTMQKVEISRWPAHEPGLKIYDVKVLNSAGEIVDQINVNQRLDIEISIQADLASCYDVYFVIVLFTEDGRWLTRHCSSKMEIRIKKNSIYTARIQYDKILLGDGRYIFSAGIYKILDLNDLSTARYYDLLSRSFEFKVYGNLPGDTTIFHHPARWVLSKTASHSFNDENEYINSFME